MANLAVAFSATVLDAEITKDNNGLEGKTLVWVAEDMAALWVAYQFTHTLVNMNLLYELGQVSSRLQGFTASLAATNLSDERYYSCYDANNCWFGEERRSGGFAPTGRDRVNRVSARCPKRTAGKRPQS